MEKNLRKPTNFISKYQIFCSILSKVIHNQWTPCICSRSDAPYMQGMAGTSYHAVGMEHIYLWPTCCMINIIPTRVAKSQAGPGVRPVTGRPDSPSLSCRSACQVDLIRIIDIFSNFNLIATRACCFMQMLPVHPLQLLHFYRLCFLATPIFGCNSYLLQVPIKVKNITLPRVHCLVAFQSMPLRRLRHAWCDYCHKLALCQGALNCCWASIC